MINLDLTGKTAIVGGASQGIGRATAKELAAAGANVILIARTESNLKKVLAELDTTLGQCHEYIKTDYQDPAILLAEMENFLTRYKKPVHIIVNNTGGPTPGPANSANSDDFVSAFKQHLICNHILMQMFLPGMKKEGFGRLINIISTSVKLPLPNLGVSNTVRAAVANWAKTLSMELAPFGITVNNVKETVETNVLSESKPYQATARSDGVDSTDAGQHNQGLKWLQGKLLHYRELKQDLVVILNWYKEQIEAAQDYLEDSWGDADRKVIVDIKWLRKEVSKLRRRHNQACRDFDKAVRRLHALERVVTVQPYMLKSRTAKQSLNWPSRSIKPVVAQTPTSHGPKGVVKSTRDMKHALGKRTGSSVYQSCGKQLRQGYTKARTNGCRDKTRSRTGSQLGAPAWFTSLCKQYGFLRKKSRPNLF